MVRVNNNGDLQVESRSLNKETLKEQLADCFKKLKFHNHPCVVVLARSQATCRYLKIPGTKIQEIERMLTMQAAVLLPYPQDKLVCVYQIIQTDKSNFTHADLVIVHKELILKILDPVLEFKPRKVSVLLSSYGLGNFARFIKQESQNPVMLSEFNDNQAEVAIVQKNKILFGRSFRLDRTAPSWEKIFCEELLKTKEAYLKETQGLPLEKLVLFYPQGAVLDKEKFASLSGISVETFDYTVSLKLPDEFKKDPAFIFNGWAALFGFSLGLPEKSLNLLPLELKEKQKKLTSLKDAVLILSFLFLSFVLWAVILNRGVQAKGDYLKKIQARIAETAKEAMPLEEMEKRFENLNRYTDKKSVSLEILGALGDLIPQEVFLSNFIYAQEEISLRGQAKIISQVLEFVKALEKSSVFKGYEIKIKFATQRGAAKNEAIDFEISCLKS